MTNLRWEQRFQNFENAYNRFCDAVKRESNDELLQAGLIQTFEFTFELAWKTLKDYLQFYGFKVSAPREVIKQAFQEKYIKDGEVWLDALEKRNVIAHTYNEGQAKEVVKLIKEKYFPIIKDAYVFFKREQGK
ncbi:nucleotidyltransferase substrate binding protein [bacterium]|nr:nucleotidyltransferase substrate binding protein [bacterium]